MDFKCEILSWDDAWRMSLDLSSSIRASGFAPDALVGVVRGGLVPLMCLSDLLRVYDVFTLRASHWGETARKDQKAVLRTPLTGDVRDKRVLLVDDLTDSGESLALALEHVRESGPLEVKTATLIHKSSSSLVPDFYSSRMDSWKWVVFPWNLREDLMNLSAKIAETRDIKKAFREEFGVELSDDMLSLIQG